MIKCRAPAESATMQVYDCTRDAVTFSQAGQSMTRLTACAAAARTMIHPVFTHGTIEELA